MAWTYSGDPAASDLDMVRFLIGDTDTADQQLFDAEINALLASNSVIGAAVQCCQTIAAKYARKADKSIDDLRLSYSQISKSYYELAKSLRSSPQAIAAVAPYAGGISISDMQTNEENTDIPAPAFTRDLHNDPARVSSPWDTEDRDASF